MLNPVNDLCMVEITPPKAQLVEVTKDTSESGILVSLPTSFPYFGFWSFAFENSLLDAEKMIRLHQFYSGLIGKRVFWTALSEKGNIIKSGDKTYAFVKLTSLIASDDADSDARNIHSDGKGSFSA